MGGERSDDYRERLWAPASYWAIGLFFGLTSVSAITFLLGDLALLLGVGGTVCAVAWVLLAWGSLTIRVDDRGLSVGSNLLEWQWLGEAQAIPAEDRRVWTGHRDAFAVLRPYVGGLVAVAVGDPADPHPFWLVSTRRPAELVRAIERRRPVAPEDHDGPALDSRG